MPRFNVNVFAVSEQGDRSHLGETTLDADDELHAQILAHEHLWDPRLDSASCSPVYETEQVDEEFGLFGGLAL